MSSRPVPFRIPRWFGILVCVGLPIAAIQAHPGASLAVDVSAQAATAPAPQKPVAVAPAITAATPRPIALEDILAWKNIGSAAISSDGKWLTYRLSPVQGDSEVIVRAAEGDKEHRFTIGEVPPPPETTGGGPPPVRAPEHAFSEDGRWLAFTVFPARKEAERLRRSRRPIQNTVRLLDLSTGTDIEYPRWAVGIDRVCTS